MSILRKGSMERHSKREKTVNILDKLYWTVQPPIGVILGDYFREENWFAPHFAGDQGYHGILEVVRDQERIVWIRFNEINNPTYYIKKYQGVSKRLSDYCFFQATKERTEKTGVVLTNGLVHLENQMIAENRLTGSFDVLCGASNSIKRSMLPLAEKISGRLLSKADGKYYGIAESLGGGVTGHLQVVINNGSIIQCFYDEIFADREEEIDDPELKPYYRQSKYHCLDYVSTLGIGFNIFSEMISARVQATQNLLDLDGLPFSNEIGCAVEWDNYIRLATKLNACVNQI